VCNVVFFEKNSTQNKKMDEETKTEIQEVDKKPEQVENLLLQAKEQVAAYKAENDRKELLIKREEEANAIRLLSGTATAGQPTKTPEELEKDKSQRLADEITNAFK